MKRSEINPERRIEKKNQNKYSNEKNQIKSLTELKKGSNQNLQNNELNDKKQAKKITEQNKQERDLSKKAKKIKNELLSPKKNKAQDKPINNNIRENNDNDTYSKKMEKKLRDSSISKNKFNNKKEKKNDFLKSSININADPDLYKLIDNNKNNNNKKNENDIINNIFNPITKNDNRLNNFFNPNTNLNKNNINIRKTQNPNIFKFNEEKGNKNNEPIILKDNNIIKDIEKDINKDKEKEINKEIELENKFQIKPSSKTNTSQSINKNKEEKPIKKQISKSINKNGEEFTYKRSSAKKNTYQSLSLIKEDKPINPFLERKRSLKITNRDSSLKNSLKDSIKKSNTVIKKNINSNSINNIIIPLLNRTKENNCFLNVIIQVIFNLVEFKKELLENNEDLQKLSQTVTEFYNLLKSYGEEQIKNRDNKGPIEPILSVNNLRNFLNNRYNCYRPGETGDPMETLGYIFDIIHKTYCKKRRIDYKKVEDCKCPSHQYFFLKLVDIISCPHCNVRKIQMFNKDCFMFDIFIKEITNKLHGKNFNSYKLKLFSKLKEHNETYDDENKIKIPGCNCNKIMMASYEKKLKLNGPSNTYLIINITWAEEFPSMLEILKSYALIPLKEAIENLFTFGEDIKTKINDIYYIKSIILYGIYHYVCIIYQKELKRWAIIDDKTIKFKNKYFDLIDFLLRNHLMPVGIIYSKDRSDEISENEIKSNTLNKEEYLRLYQFCKDVDIRRGLKVSDLILSKGSFNENNENYLNNNYFYKSIIDFNDSFKNNNTPFNGKKNEKNFINQKTYIKPNNLKNLDNNGSNKNIHLFNKDNNIKRNEDNSKNDILSGRKIYGDFSNNNLKGGILILSSSLNDNNGNNEKSGQTKEESDMLDFGKNYDGDYEN